MKINTIYHGDSLQILKTLPDESIDCCVTSPPYWGLRDYGVDGQLGLEKIPEEYVAKMVEVFKEVKRVLKKEGTLWLNLGDSYAGGQSSGDKKFGNEEFNKNRTSRERTLTPERKRPKRLKPKDLVGIPWAVAFALRADGWYLRQDIIWHKPNPMPESVTDRCTKAHEYIFLLAKSQKYYFDGEAIKELSVTNEDRPFGIVRDRIYDYDSKQKQLRKRTRKIGEGQDTGIGRKGCCGDSGTRNKRSVWTINTKPYKGAHFATFPEDLVTPCILAGCPKGGIVLDPFTGSGTTCAVAKRLERNYIGIELNQNYIKLAEERIAKERTLFNDHHS